MPEYNERHITDSVDLTRYERAHKVEVYNPLNAAPSIAYRTSWIERDNETGVEVSKELYRTLTASYDSNETFDLYDAAGNVVGQADYDTLMGVLYGLFFHLATKEDA